MTRRITRRLTTWSPTDSSGVSLVVMDPLIWPPGSSEEDCPGSIRLQLGRRIWDWAL